MKKFYLIRHAQSESNARLAIRPNPVINLTDVGRMEAEELSEWLSINIQQPIDGVFTSHYVRTAQTAAPFLAQLGSTAKVIEALHEFDYLDFDRIKDLSFEDLIATADNFGSRAIPLIRTARQKIPMSGSWSECARCARCSMNCQMVTTLYLPMVCGLAC